MILILRLCLWVQRHRYIEGELLCKYALRDTGCGSRPTTRVMQLVNLTYHVFLSSGNGASADRLNNVERVDLPNTGGITYEVTVTGHAIAMGPQPFSLVVTGNVRHTTCTGRDPNEVFRWQASAWQTCSKPCDIGVQSRSVRDARSRALLTA